MKKRTISAMLACIMLVSMAACNNAATSSESSSVASEASSSAGSSHVDSSDTSETDTDSNLNPFGTLPLVKETETLSIFTAPPAMVEDITTNDLTKYVEELTNVKIDWQVATTADAGQKISLLLASNTDLPDVFMVKGGISTEQVVSYGSQGYFVPLNDFTANPETNLAKCYEARPVSKGASIAPDGNIYFFPIQDESYHVSYSSKYWLNTDWTERLGLEIPTTIDEFYEVLKAFRDNDANGNGDPNDEVPCAGGLHNFLLNSFVYSAGKDNWLYLEDGVVTPTITQDGFKEALKFYQKLYQENLLAKEIFIISGNQLKMLSGDENGNCLGGTDRQSMGGFVDFGTGRQMDYTAIAPLTGPTGLKQTPLSHFNPTPGFLITKDCENPELAMRWADLFMADPMTNTDYINLHYGVEGRENTWAKAEEGEIALDGTQALYKWTFNWGDTLNTHWYTSVGPCFRSQEFKSAIVADTSSWNQEVVLYNATKENYAPYGADKSLPQLLMTEADAQAISESKTLINSYVAETMARLVTTDADIEAEWPGFLKELDNMGLQQYITSTQNAYDAQYGNL